MSLGHLCVAWPCLFYAPSCPRVDGCLHRVGQIKRVIQGEGPGDLVLEEDLSVGGGGVPIGDGGLAEDQLQARKGSSGHGPMVRRRVASI